MLKPAFRHSALALSVAFLAACSSHKSSGPEDAFPPKPSRPPSPVDEQALDRALEAERAERAAFDEFLRSEKTKADELLSKTESIFAQLEAFKAAYPTLKAKWSGFKVLGTEELTARHAELDKEWHRIVDVLSDETGYAFAILERAGSLKSEITKRRENCRQPRPSIEKCGDLYSGLDIAIAIYGDDRAKADHAVQSCRQQKADSPASLACDSASVVLKSRRIHRDRIKFVFEVRQLEKQLFYRTEDLKFEIRRRAGG